MKGGSGLGARGSGAPGRHWCARAGLAPRTPESLAPNPDPLFIPQRHHRIDLRRPTGGEVAGEQRHSYERSEEHTSELQSQSNLVCRLLLEKKKKKTRNNKYKRTY